MTTEKGKRLFVNKHLPNFDKKILALFLVCLSISSLTIFGVFQVLATPAPSRNTSVEPGWSGFCTDMIYVDGTTPVDHPTNGNPNTVGTAGQDLGAFINTFYASGHGYCFEPGTYTVNTNILPLSNSGLLAIPGTVTLLRSVSGNIIQKTTTLFNFTVNGFTFDLGRQTGTSGIVLQGSDASGQINTVTISNCIFKNPGNTWDMQINYVIVDPAIPAKQNQHIRVVNTQFYDAGQSFTLDSILVVNSNDVLFDQDYFGSDPANVASQLDIYGYSTNVRISNSFFENFASLAGLILQEVNKTVVTGNTFDTTTATNGIYVRNSQYVSIVNNQFRMATAGTGVTINDIGGTTFDGHTDEYTNSARLLIGQNVFTGGDQAVQLNALNYQSQSDIIISNNVADTRRELFILTNIPNAPTGTIERITIEGNDAGNNQAFSTAWIWITGNAVAANGGVENILISGNNIPKSGSPSARAIAIDNKANNVTITGNRVSDNITIANAATNVRVINNDGFNPQGWGIVQLAVPSTGIDQTNNKPYPVLIYITGVGTGITAYGITDPAGTLTSFTLTVTVGMSFTVNPNGKIRLTYTGAPTWKWYGL